LLIMKTRTVTLQARGSFNGAESNSVQFNASHLGPRLKSLSEVLRAERRPTSTLISVREGGRSAHLGLDRVLQGS
jgi:hypothetical protein